MSHPEQPAFPPRPPSSVSRRPAPSANSDDVPTTISLSQARPAEPVNWNGQRLGHFELLDTLGTGGMATVVRARDLELGRIVALKILPPEGSADPDSVARFKQEARTAALLDDDHIARVYFCGEDQGLHFIAFEYVAGATLKALVEERGPLPTAEALGYLRQAAEGLAHAHEQGVVHRDVKPSNVLVTEQGLVKVVDLGLAREVGPTDGGVTQSGVTLGTFDYIAPEQALDPRGVDGRADIYALGCTFYHVLTGRPPVPDGTAAKKLHFHQQMRPVDPRRLNPEIPDGVADLLAKMMAKRPDDRYDTPRELVTAVERLQERPTRAPEPAGRPWLKGVLGVAAFTAVALALMYVGPRAELRLPGVAQPQVGKADPTPPPAEVVVSNAAELLRQAARPTAVVFLAPGATYELPAGLVFRGESLELRGTAAQPTTLKLPSDSKAEAVVALTGPGATLRCVGVRFVGGNAAGVLAEGKSTVTLDGCELAFGGPGLVVRPGDGTRPEVNLANCLFAGGSVAVQADGPIRLQANECAFGPYRDIFRLRGVDAEASDEQTRTSVKLTHCTTLQEAGNVFALGDDFNGSLKAAHCLFAQATTKEPGVVLVRRRGQPGAFRYAGGSLDLVRNVYFGLAGVWRDESVKPVEEAASLTEAATLGYPVEDAQAVELHDTSPFLQADPLALFATDPAKALTLRTDQRNLRRSDMPKMPVGVTKRGTRNLYATPLPVPPTPSPPPRFDARRRVVDPSLPIGSLLPGHYRKLSIAVEDAQPGDEIVLRHNGPLEVDQVRIDKADARITIRPDDGFKPVLVLKSPDRDAALVRLYHGSVSFENLEFRLKPEKSSDEGRQAVALIVGSGQCHFHKCLLTLEETDGVQLAAVALADSESMVKSSGMERNRHPQVSFRRCTVRGRGDLIEVRSSRPFDATAEESLFALQGDLLSVDPGKEPPDAPATLTLDRVTALLGDSLLALHRGKDAEMKPTLATTRVTAKNCLFAALSSKPLVRLDGVDGEGMMRTLFAWGGQNNSYVNYAADTPAAPPMLEWTPAGGAPATPPGGVQNLAGTSPLNAERWKALTQEDAKFAKAKFGEIDLPRFRQTDLKGLHLPDGGVGAVTLPE